MSLTDFDKELLATNLLGATTLKELHQKEKIVTNAKMIALQNKPVVGQLDYAHRLFMEYVAKEVGYILSFRDVKSLY